VRLEQGIRDWGRIGGGEVLRSCVGDLDVSLATGASGNMNRAIALERDAKTSF